MKIESIVISPDKSTVTAVKEPIATTLHLGAVMGDFVARFEDSRHDLAVIMVTLKKVK